MAAIEITIDREADLATATAFGAVSESDFMDAFHRFYAQNPTGRILWDFSKASLANLSFTKINNFLQGSALSGRPALGKTAVVVRPSYAYGMVRIFETLQEMQNVPYETQSFGSTKDAFAWFYRGAGPINAVDTNTRGIDYAN